MLRGFFVLFFLHLPILYAFYSSEETDFSNIIVGFYPYVSVHDIYNSGRYTTDDIDPMVSKVATKFAKILTWLDYSNLSLDLLFSSSLSVYATAKYNCLNTTKRKVQLHLGIMAGDHCNCSIIQKISELATKYADEVNELCNETTNTILLMDGFAKLSSLFDNCEQVLNLTDRYIWGESMSVSNYCNPENVWNTTNHPAVVALDYFDSEVVFTHDVKNCKPFKENTKEEPTIIKSLTVSDTNRDNEIIMKKFLSYWEKAANESNQTFLFSEAFDTYTWGDKNTMSASFSGWWYLMKDTGTTNTSEFIFEEKLSVAARLEYDENPKYMRWYSNKAFHKNTTGLLFENNLTTIASKTHFCRIISFVFQDSLEKVVENAVNMIDSCGQKFQLYLLITKLSSEDLQNLQKLKNGQVAGLVPLNRNVLPRGFDTSYPKTIKESGFKLGYSIDMDYCGQYIDEDISIQSMIYDALADAQSSVHVFYYSEYKDTVKQGATRMFRIRSVLFQACRKLVLKIRNESSEIGLALQAFYKGSDFYESNWAMKNYVKYIELISDWVENYTDTVVFLGSDEDRTFKDSYRGTWNTAGWYSYDDFLEKQGYKPKIDQFLNPSIFDNIYYKFLLVIFSMLAIVIPISLVLIYFIRRYRKYRLTYQEAKVFFNGRLHKNDSEGSNQIDIKYDKERYEVATENFKVNTTEDLGSGEFGKVCCGTIIVGDEEIQVAVKTMNPQKQHITMLKGLLSEIKVLSYIGQHPNIIRLFGANTSGLKNRKVYVFFELCNLGSLKSVLQKLRTPESLSFSYPTAGSLDNIKYVNITSSSKALLDPSLSNDFYKWSKEICSGMEYLHQKHVVHADLSTRNVLLSSEREAKIYDFGLARRMYNYEYYVKSQQEPMPWRWMAPESLRDMMYNEKTDAWAYGVTIWEIYSLASLPYAGLTWDANFVRMLEGGLVPAQPDFEEKNMSVNDNIFILMNIFTNKEV